MDGFKASLRTGALALALLALQGCCSWRPMLFHRGEIVAVTNEPAVVGNKNDSTATMGPEDRTKMQELQSKAAEAEQDRQRLVQRIRELEAALADKEHALGQVSEEIRAGTDEVARTRSELQRWNREMSDLRARLQAAERENVTTLQSVITTLEHMLGPAAPGASAPKE